MTLEHSTHSTLCFDSSTQMAPILFKFVTFLLYISFLIKGSLPHDTEPPKISGKGAIDKHSYASNVPQKRKFETKPRVRLRSVQAARTLGGSMYKGLRPDYLLTITLPSTLGMFSFVILLLVCMRSDGWLYHLFTDDYVPPAVKKRLEEEARRTEGKKARVGREDNWNEVKKQWEEDLAEVTQRVEATLPPDSQQKQSSAKT